VDDAGFELDYHLRHLSLPTPGGVDQLKQVVGWIVGQAVDLARPPWEMWVVEGVEGGKHFAVVTKMHHCMIDGGSGVNLMQVLLRAEPDRRIPEARPFEPRAAPSRAELATWELSQRLRTPLRLLGGLRRFGSESSNPVATLRQRIGAFGELTENALPAAKTPISGVPLGPHRRIDWLDMPLDEVTTLRRALGCSLNDLVLAMVAGALRRYLGRRGVELAGLDFRVSIPVNVRRDSENEEMGNRISSWIIPMPLDEPDPRAQLAAISRRTGECKHSNQAIAVEMMMAAAEEFPALLALSARAMQGQISMVVTNVPGPPIPLYLLGCRALGMQPLVPLFPGVGLGVACLSYDGTLHWGFQGEYDLVPDLPRFVEDVRDAQAALSRCSRKAALPPKRPGSSSGRSAKRPPAA
jgi:WS/DGAT/MGAT family acyltransferase